MLAAMKYLGLVALLLVTVGCERTDRPAPAMCPAAAPSPGAACTGSASCEFGTESCCGETHPSLVCSCSGGTWACYYTDACLVPFCGDAGPNPDGGPGLDGGPGMDGAPACVPADAGGPTDGGPVGDAGVCGPVATTCPTTAPYAGAPCAGALDCPYMDSLATWQYTCVGGQWQETLVECTSFGGCVPALGERCTTVFTGTLSGATVEIGPSSGPFRPFADCEVLPLVWGGQGAPMMSLRIRVTGVEAPECIMTAITLTSGATIRDRTVFRCGETLPLLVVVPFDLCTPEAALIPVDIRVELEGIGSVTAHVSVESNCTPLPG